MSDGVADGFLGDAVEVSAGGVVAWRGRGAGLEAAVHAKQFAGLRGERFQGPCETALFRGDGVEAASEAASMSEGLLKQGA